MRRTIKLICLRAVRRKNRRTVDSDSLIDVDLLEAEAEEEFGQGGIGILAGGGEDPGGQRGVLQILFGFGADFGLEVGIGLDEPAGVAGVDAGLAVVERGDEDLRGRQVDYDTLVVDGDVRGVSRLRSIPAIACPWTSRRSLSPTRKSGRMVLERSPSTTLSMV